jgi:predicted KAP-like P-loop ATPase
MTSPASQTHGFDAAVTRREDDQLNRWPFAREIYGIATGPRDWSVRVGIYGEWGTGKTSVLEFIAAMARRDGQIVIRFNPWEHSTKDALWRAFVLAIFKEPRLAKAAGAKPARAKGLLGSFLKRARIIEAGTGVWNEKAAKGVGAGLDLVKSFLA